jgi:predicted RNase H-like HicB family nuclease
MRVKRGSYSDVEAESPDVERWYAAGDTYAEVAKLAEEGVRFALERDDVVVEHFVP